MKNIRHTLTKQLIAAIAAAALFTPIVASAQDYADAGDQQIQGTVSSINGTWNITVNDANGYRDSVELHQGTVINPTGLTLEPGMNVTIDGYADGANFEAMEIDTPYQYQGPAPAAVYYGPGTWYPGYASGWGPSFSLFLNLNTRQYEQRSFAFGGQVRRPLAPPSGWQNRPHGFIGNAGNARQQHTAYIAPRPQFQQQRSEPRRDYAAPQQPQRTYAAPQRTFAAPQQQQQPQRTFAAPQQPQRTFAPPQQTQQRAFSDQRQQQRSFAAPQQQQQARPAAQPQEARPVQPQRDFSSPTGRMGAVSAPPREANQQRDDRRR